MIAYEHTQQRVVTDRFEEVELGPADGVAVPLASALDSRIIFLRKLLDELQSEIESLHRKQQHVLSLAIADPKEKDVLEDQIAKIRRKTFDLRKMVNEVDNEFSEFARVCPSQGEVRIRKNQIDLIRKKLRDVIIRFNETHADYRSRVSVRVRRQLRAVGENITEEEADKIIDSAGRDELFFREVNPLSVSARAALTDVKRRHNEIVELEKSIQEMQEIFIDLQNLTEVQGDIVDNIERNVDTTKVHVEEGARNVKVGLEYKKSATRKKDAWRTQKCGALDPLKF
ncbi:SNARE domain protein [Teladorsagia circumcincta]|uniref:SNARE domain protein n=1 Tax=Teladorsagia circumcincta TaxID=45464 RepID=A0A2G9UY02_TELCI|nr:SNARE domain protein [Teladorsagia circumcincta]